MKHLMILIDNEAFLLKDLGEQNLSSAHLRSDICFHYCDLCKQCGKFLYNAAVPCMLAGEKPDEGTGFYFKKIDTPLAEAFWEGFNWSKNNK